FGRHAKPETEAKPKARKRPVVKEEEAEPEEAEEDQSEDAGRGSISLGMLVHGFLSLEARIARLLLGRRAAPLPPRRGAAAAPGGVEPRFAGERAPEPTDVEDEGEAEEAPAPRPRKAAAPRTPQKRASGGYVLPPLSVLAAPKASDRATLSRDAI